MSGTPKIPTLRELREQLVDADCWLGVTPAGEMTLESLWHRVNPAAAIALAERELSVVEAEQAEARAEYGLTQVTDAAVAAVAGAPGHGHLSEFDAFAVADLDVQADAARQRWAGEANHAAWLDTTPLAAPPDPDSEADFNRDRRRYFAMFEQELSHETWSMYADSGADVVASVASDRCTAELKELAHSRENLIETSRHRAAVEAADAAARAEGAPPALDLSWR